MADLALGRQASNKSNDDVRRVRGRCIRINFPNYVVQRIDNEAISERIEHYGQRAKKARAAGWTVVSRITASAVARPGVDLPVGGHLAHDIVVVVADVDVADLIHPDADGRVEFGTGRRVAVSGISGCAIAREGRDGAV